MFGGVERGNVEHMFLEAWQIEKKQENGVTVRLYPIYLLYDYVKSIIIINKRNFDDKRKI